ncbi:MAG: GNAT family N-acetyltransferase [Planctomycetaceae bacterium]|nr:GNAT family N-acetyltransferase [Planctomycetaceae bacterium]
MNNSIIIRAMQTADGEIYKRVRLSALQESPSSFGSTFAEESKFGDQVWEERAKGLTVPESIGLLAFEGERVCGIVRGSPDEEDSRIGWVESMWVDPSVRRRGVGQLLMQELIEWGRSRKLSEMKLEVTSTNSSAIRLYERCGFQATGRTVPYPNDSSLVEIEMLLKLDAM